MPRGPVSTGMSIGNVDENFESRVVVCDAAAIPAGGILD